MAVVGTLLGPEGTGVPAPLRRGGRAGCLAGLAVSVSRPPHVSCGPVEPGEAVAAGALRTAQWKRASLVRTPSEGVRVFL